MNSFNPTEPNTTRQIHLKYVTDEEGKLSIFIDAEGFENGEDYVALYLSNTIDVISGLKSSDIADN